MKYVLAGFAALNTGTGLYEYIGFNAASIAMAVLMLCLLIIEVTEK